MKNFIDTVTEFYLGTRNIINQLFTDCHNGISGSTAASLILFKLTRETPKQGGAFREGIIKAPDEAFRNRYLKDGIISVMSFPAVALVDENGGSALMRVLIRFKERVARTFAALPDRSGV